MIGVCSVAGLLSLFVSLIPRAVIAPIFIFIGFEIMRQAYNDSPPAHSPAVSLSILPVIASLVLIILGQFMGAMGATPDKLPMRLQIMHQTLTMLIPICIQDDTVIYSRHGGVPCRERFKSVLKTYKEPSSYVIKRQQ